MIPESLKPFLRPIYAPLANLYYELFKAPRRYSYLFKAIQTTKATKIMEIGTWNGNRAVQMIEQAKKLSPDAKIEYYGFDLFESLSQELYESEISKHPPTKEEVSQKLSATGAAVHLYAGNTHDTLPSQSGSLPEMDFIFIDGGHHVDTIRNDWTYASKLMHKGTIVLFDDYWRNRPDEGCKPIVDAIDTNTYSVEVLPIIDSFNTPEFGRLDISFARITLREGLAL